MCCHECQVHLCITKTKNVFGIFPSKENIDLLCVNQALIYSFENIFMVLEQ